MMFIKYAAVQLQQLGLKKQMEPVKQIEVKKEEGAEKESEMEEDEAKRIVEGMTDSITSGEKKEVEDSTKQIVQKAALAVGSLKETEFDIRFNPDVFSPGVVHPKDNVNFKKECQLVQDAADFLITVQIPAFIRDCLDHSTAPMDGNKLFRANNVAERRKYVELVDKVKETGGDVKIFSSLHISGEQLDQLSGICALLRFPMAEIEETDDS